ncbi:GNAT family N-acetyltransferase [Nocardioides aurantiacus]|uniref:RimJ/RimL family protein N-acetyltransferase n=1 Tax=Nocardioides aurantiacus TaxID=86796 RepID=A0A3N2CSU5_9ACTN|nr:GNAT family N-acetyltransferase [Nocardioides aurantiacus]ROR90611.1 RimJ/RimL family protein N-acetyltransferase [Nocardioides aurantiacus]
MVDVRLVPLRDAHVPDVLAVMADPDVLRFTRTPHVVTEDWVRGWVARFDGRDRLAWAVVDPHDTFLGYAVTGPVDHEGGEVELGYAVAPSARRRGVATAALLAMARWAFEEAALQRVTALVSTGNPASSAVARRAGFTLEGVLRSVHHRDDERVDLECWSLLPHELAAT